MRNLSVSVTAALLLSASATAADRGQRNNASEAMNAREEIRETHRLAAGATVRVEGIAGPVTVETGGGDSAEVHIVRMAASERELQCYRTRVEAAPDRLVVSHVQLEDRPGCDNIRSRQEVRLRLPRAVDLELSSIAGALEIGAVEGALRLDSIAGRVRLAGAREARISSLAGGLTLGVGALGPEGMRISSVVGPVALRFAPGADASLSADSVMGSVRGEAIDVVEDEGRYRAQVGDGGPRIAISSVVGSVRLSRQ